MDNLLKFTEFAQKFRTVKRMITFSDGLNENDAEHSYELALIAWYIIETEKLNLDKELVLKYAIAHDLVEIYAGDTPAAIHKKYLGEVETKKAREAEAFKRIISEFPEFTELHKIIENYEEKKDEESKFVCALDKILPIINIFIDKGHSWRVHEIDMEELIAHKKEKIKESPVIEKYFMDLIDLLRKNPDFFNNK